MPKMQDSMKVGKQKHTPLKSVERRAGFLREVLGSDWGTSMMIHILINHDEAFFCWVKQ